MAESLTARQTLVLTLTYGKDENGESDHMNASVLTYSDVQKWIKKLRKAGAKLRYFAVGEYGSTKARAHWHVILFNYGHEIQIELNRNVQWAPWDHGHVYADKANVKSMAYVMKYIAKSDDGTFKSFRCMMSKKPPIGAMWFEKLAQQYIEAGIVPTKNEYTIPNVLTRNGQNKTFWMTDNIKQIFLSEYLRLASIRKDRRTSKYIEENYHPVPEPFELDPAMKKREREYRDLAEIEWKTGNTKGL